MYFFLVFAAFIFICFLVASAIFKNDPDEQRRTKKIVASTILIAALGIAGIIYLIVAHEKRSDAIEYCKGYEGKIVESKLFGKWQIGYIFLDFKDDHSYQLTTINGTPKYGTWKIEYNVLYLSSQAENGESTISTYKFCDFADEEFIFREQGKRDNQTAKKVPA